MCVVLLCVAVICTKDCHINQYRAVFENAEVHRFKKSQGLVEKKNTNLVTQISQLQVK